MTLFTRVLSLKQIFSSPHTQHLLDSTPLFEFSTLVNSTLDLKFILGSVLLTLMAKLRVTKSLVLLKMAPQATLKVGENRFRVENCKGIGSDLLRKDILLARPPKKDFSISSAAPPVWKVFSRAGIRQIFPIISHDTVLGYFGIGGRIDTKLKTPRKAGRFSSDEKEFVDIFINVAASAIDKGIAFQELRSVNRTLDGKIQELKTLFELSKEFTAVVDRERLLKLFGFTLMGHIGANRYAVCLKDGGVVASRIDTSPLLKFKEKVFSLVTSPMRVADFPKRKVTAAIKAACEAAGIAAIVPLQSQNEVKGIVCLGERLRGSGYSQADLEFIYSIGNLAIISLENSRLFNEAIEKQKMEDELTIAREIQNGLLPKSLPEIPGFQIAALNCPSKQVGGDYYDVIRTNNGKFVLAIGDVSGKGTPASLLMANVQATIRALVPFDLPLAECTARVNDLLFENTNANKFITFFWGALDPDSRLPAGQAGTLRYVNAGHNHPFVITADGTVKRLGEGGLILGIMKALMPYREGSVAFETGDMLVLFTDGVSEAMDNDGNEYTEERLESFLRTVSSRMPQEIISAVQEDVARHVSGAPQSDDITLIVVKAV